MNTMSLVWKLIDKPYCETRFLRPFLILNFLIKGFNPYVLAWSGDYSVFGFRLVPNVAIRGMDISPEELNAMMCILRYNQRILGFEQKIHLAKHYCFYPIPDDYQKHKDLIPHEILPEKMTVIITEIRASICKRLKVGGDPSVASALGMLYLLGD